MQPVWPSQGQDPGSVPSKTKLSSTSQTAVLTEDHRGAVCVFIRVHGYSDGSVST